MGHSIFISILKDPENHLLMKIFPKVSKFSKSAIASVPPSLNIEYECQNWRTLWVKRLVNQRARQLCPAPGPPRPPCAWARPGWGWCPLSAWSPCLTTPHTQSIIHREAYWHLPNSWVVIFPSPLISNSENASLNSSIWSSDMSIPSISIILHNTVEVMLVCCQLLNVTAAAAGSCCCWRLGEGERTGRSFNDEGEGSKAAEFLPPSFNLNSVWCSPHLCGYKKM